MDKKILTINDTIHGMIELTSLEKEIISSSLFNRLHDVYQNSTVYLTFPTNRTKRFEHSIGAMHLVGEMYFNSLYNSLMSGKEYVIKQFTEDANKKIKDLINKMQNESEYSTTIKVCSHLNILHNLNNFDVEKLTEKDSEDLFDCHIQKRFRLFSADNSKITSEQSNIIATIYQAVRIAALLHDIGHPPFSHITEGALERVREHLDIDNTNRIAQFKNIFDNAINLYNDETDGHMQLHEVIGIKIVHSIFDNLDKNATGDLKEQEYKRVAFRLLIGFCVSEIMANSDFWKDLHRLIDNSIDCDRLDYIVRDSNASGILGFQIEYSRIISGMQLQIRQNSAKSKEYVFAFVAKTISNIESFFLKRMELYKSIVFHHRVVKTDKLFSDVIEALSLKYLQESSEDSINESDLPNDISALWRVLKYLNTSSKDTSYQLLSWNDSCLITILKQEYFKLLDKKSKIGINNDDQILIDKLEEILINKKTYFSVIKRNYDFDVLDNACANVLIENNALEEICKMFEKQECDNLLLKNLEELNTIIKNKRKLSPFLCSSTRIFIINFISHFIINSKSDFKNLVLKCVNVAKEIFNKENKDNDGMILDIFADIKHVKNGIGENEVLLYRPHIEEDTLINLTDNSNINEILLLHEFYTPSIFIYIKKSKTDKKLNDLKFLELLGKQIGNEILQNLKKHV